MNKASLKERLLYWFDSKMANGSLSLIRFLIIISILLTLLLATIIIALGLNTDAGPLAVIWDSIATVINAWMPFYEDGSGNIGYLILMSITAIAGVLFTSVLIGIIASAIEEKIISLKQGNSKVIEEGHTVVLGFNPGEYTLIRQLILAAAGNRSCVVVADNMNKEEMERHIKDNIVVPDNVRVICRSANIHDPAALERCSLNTCRNIIVHPAEDFDTIKTILAVSASIQKSGGTAKPVNAIIAKREHGFPPSLAEKNNITVLQTNDTLAKMIAHSCTQVGLSETFKEVFNFEGSELYIVRIPVFEDYTFAQLMTILDNAVPVGLFRDGVAMINPPGDTLVEKGDSIIIFSENASAYRVVSDVMDGLPVPDSDETIVTREDETDTVIIGYNDSLRVILRELPENVHHVYLAGNRGTEEQQERIEQIAAKRGIELQYIDGDLIRGDTLQKIAQLAEHIILLNDHEKPDEAADMETIFLLLNLRELRTRYGFGYNITAEMRREHNQSLVVADNHTDFLVASSMSSLFLAQLSENPNLMEAFSELLSNEGSELYLKSASDLQCEGTYTIRELRRFAIKKGLVLLGIKDEEHHSLFNPSLDTAVKLDENSYLIVLSEN